MKVVETNNGFTITGAANKVYDDEGELIMLSDADLEREVMRALAPIRARSPRRTQGRKPRYRSAATFTEDAIEAHIRLKKESRTKDLWENQYEYSQEQIADEMGFHDVSGWRRRARALSINLDQLKADALLAERNLPKGN